GDGTLRALDPDSGKTRWKHRSFDIDHVAVDGDEVFIVDHFATRLTMLHAKAGDERWGRPWPNGRKVPMYPVATASAACFGYDTVTALDRKDGDRRWSARVKAELGIALAEDLVITFDRTTVSALDLGNGRPRWTYPAEWAH